jgi:hypothetical protein
MAKKTGRGQDDFGGDFTRHGAYEGHYILTDRTAYISNTIRPKDSNTGSAHNLFHHWTILEELDPTNPHHWSILLSRLHRVLEFAGGEKIQTRLLTSRSEFLELASISFDPDDPLVMSRLRISADYWPADHGVIIVPSGQKRLAQMAYRCPGEMHIKIVQEIPLHEVIRPSGVTLLKSADEVDVIKLGGRAIGFIGKKAAPYAQFKEAMYAAAATSAVNPEQVIMIVAAYPTPNKKRKCKYAWNDEGAARVEESDWERMVSIWLASSECRSGDLLMFFAVDSALYNAAPMSQLLAD